MIPAAGRFLHRLLLLVLALGVTVVAVVAGLAWRLSQGPMDVGWVARRAEAAFNTPDQSGHLLIGGATLAWAGFADGPGRELELRLQNVRLLGADEQPVAAVNTVGVNLAMGLLLLGRVVPRDVSATGLVLHLVRAADGSVALDGEPLPDTTTVADAGPATSLSDVVGELVRPPPRDPTQALEGVQHLEQLRRVHLSGATVLVYDAGLRATARLAIGELDLRRQSRGGIRGVADATVAMAAAQASIALQAELSEDGGTTLTVAMAPVAAGAMQQAAAEQGAIEPAPAVLEAAVQAAATVVLDRDLHPVSATVHAEAGAGHVLAAGTPVAFESLLLDARVQWPPPPARNGWRAPGLVEVTRARAVVRAPRGAWPTTLAAEGRADLTGPRVRVSGALTFDHLAFADVPALWPERLGGHTRPWLTENITGGTARDGSVKVSVEAARDGTDVVLTAIDGSLVGEDVTIHWLRPVPPVEHAQARLLINNPETLDILISGARQGVMQLKDGVVHFTGLSHKDQFMTLNSEMAGNVADAVGLLRHPRLHLLDRKPIPMKNPGGTFTGHLAIDLPLKHELVFEDVKVDVKSHLVELRLGGTAAGRDIEHGDVTIEATQEALHLAGRAVVGTIPADLTVDMDFRNGGPAQVVQRATARARATLAQLVVAGVDVADLVTAGSAMFTLQYALKRDTTAELKVSADLAGAGLALLGWHKAPGPAASAEATVLLRADRLAGIDQLHAQAPGLEVDGRVELVQGRPLLLHLERTSLGATQARGDVRFPANPGDPIHATLTGSVLDLGPQLVAKPVPGSGPGKSGFAYVVDLLFDRVMLAHGLMLAGVVAHAENDGRRMNALTLTSTGAGRMQASIVRQGQTRHVIVRATDGGGLLRGLDVLEKVRGGQLAVDAVYDDAQVSSPLVGTVSLTDFHVRELAFLGKLLQAITVYGVVDAVNGSGVAFGQLALPFRWDGGVFEVRDAQASSASLGVTARGRIDTRRGEIDLQGTVVPAYALNAALGRIPLLGRLFSAERGGGLVAVNYSLRGALANPLVVVNPLSALTPGFLRGLFHLLD